jgi:hypothetical protein
MFRVSATGKAKLNEIYADRKLWSYGMKSLIRRLRVVNETAVRTLDDKEEISCEMKSAER